MDVFVQFAIALGIGLLIGIVIATIANTLVKAALAGIIGGWAFARRLMTIMILATVVGGASAVAFFNFQGLA